MKKTVFCTDMNERMRKLLSYAMKTLRIIASPYEVSPLLVSDRDPGIEGLTWLGPLPDGYMEHAKEITERFPDYGEGLRPSPYMAARLFLPFLDGLSDGPFVYVDTDVEFVSPQWLGVFDMDIGSADCGAVYETHPAAAASMERYSRFAALAGNDISVRVGRGELANSGMMLMSPGNVRANHPDFAAEAVEWACRLDRQGLYFDQDIVNLMFRTVRVPERYNVIVGQPHGSLVYMAHYAGHPSRFSDRYPDQELRRQAGLPDHAEPLSMRPDAASRRAVQNVVRCAGAHRVCEVGSYRGESAKAMLDSGAVNLLYCVDPWASGYDVADCASSHMDGVERDFDWCVGTDPRVRKRRGTLADFADELHSAGLDLVYVDACHQYEACISDLRCVESRVRPRVVAGHDYGSDWPGVKRAVDEMFGEPDVRFPDSSWLVFLDSR